MEGRVYSLFRVGHRRERGQSQGKDVSLLNNGQKRQRNIRDYKTLTS